MTSLSKRITGTADDGAVAGPGATLRAVIVGKAVASQTIALHDCATEGAAAAGNLIVTIDTTVARDFQFGGRRCTLGLVAIVSGGTQDIAVVWG